MGTYIKIRLKNKTEKNIEKANDLLEKVGFEFEKHNGVKYGLFVTQKMLEEDSRFMNEDEEGKKQAPHLKRPITPEFLQKNFFWFEKGCAMIKYTDGRQIEKLKSFVYGEGKEMVDFESSENIEYN
jgi:hypothetical protein